jgi:hypothetical protein
MAKIYTLLLLLFIGYQANSQTITQWNFNSGADATTGTGTLTPNIGTGSIVLVGGATTPATFASGSANGGSTDPELTDDSAFGTTTYAAQSTENKARGIEIAASTVGKESIIITWDERHSNTAANTTVLQYSTDGSTFIDFQTYVATAGDTWYNTRTADLSGITALNNNANAKFRIVAAFATGTTNYVASSPTGAYGSTGTLRFDMITISGQTTLPVSLISFTGKNIEHSIVLNWQTSSETNNDFFMVERSTDGRNFKAIAKVYRNTNNEPIKTYQFVDENAIFGKNYYRLNQQDLDGKTTISKIIIVKNNFGESLKAYPNPASNNISLNITESTKAIIYSAVGMQITENQLFEGLNTIDISKFQTGIYFIKFADGQIIRFIKQ